MPHVAQQSEIRFLEHRLEVIEAWPDSPRKTATRTAILHRLEMLPAAQELRPLRAERSSAAGAAGHF